MNREEILEQAKICVCGHRQTDYGSPEDNFLNIAKLWSAYKDIKFTSKDVAVMMALLKVARIKAGNTSDSYIDLAGYAACAGEIDTTPKKNNKSESIDNGLCENGSFLSTEGVEYPYELSYTLCEEPIDSNNEVKKK